MPFSMKRFTALSFRRLLGVLLLTAIIDKTFKAARLKNMLCTKN